MDETDILVICALGLPIEQAFDLLYWGAAELRQRPAMRWWIKQHASEVSAWLARQQQERVGGHND